MPKKKAPDPAHLETEEKIEELEKRIATIYGEARDDLDDKVIAYFAEFFARDDEMRQAWLDGRITEEEYKSWRLTQIARGKRFEELRDLVAERYTSALEQAITLANDTTPGVYALNRNYAAYTIEQSVGNVGFTLFDESTIRRLLRDDPDSMPYYPPARAVKRGIDLKYGKSQITKSVTRSILEGRPIRDMADDLQSKIQTMSRTSAVRAARTAMTSAQNAGRLDSYVAAEKMGIKLQKEWLATLDGRTRHTHRRLDGERVAVDGKFSNGCRYPGDPKGKPEEVYNCRCTMVVVSAKVDQSNAPRFSRLPKNITYEDWKNGRKV